MATQFWHGTRIKRHFSSWSGRPLAGKSLRDPHAPSRSSRLSSWVRREARHSDYPDVSTYDRPATTRMTPANLGLSIVLFVSALVAFGLIAWAVFH